MSGIENDSRYWPDFQKQRTRLGVVPAGKSRKVRAVCLQSYNVRSLQMERRVPGVSLQVAARHSRKASKRDSDSQTVRHGAALVFVLEWRMRQVGGAEGMV